MSQKGKKISMRKFLNAFISLFLTLTFMVAPVGMLGAADRDILIEDIYFKGNTRTGSNYLLGKIQSKKGAVFSPAVAQNDVQELFSLGFFEDIDVEMDYGKNGVVLGFVVVEKPRISRIIFEGNNNYKNKRLLKKSELTAGTYIDEGAISRGLEKIREYYEKKGYKGTRVDYELVRDKENPATVDLKIIVNEGRNVRVADIVFHGNDHILAKDLKKIMRTKERFLLYFRTGKFNEDNFKDDLDRIVIYFYSKGYIDAQIKDVKIEDISAKRIRIDITIEEGQLYQMGDFSIAGYEKFPLSDLEPLVTLKKGETFLPPELSRSVSNLRDYYYNRGYIDVSVQAVKKLDLENNEIDVDFKLEENEISYINEVKIEGNPKTRDIVIRRELNVYPGEIFNGVSVRTSQSRIRNLNYFKKVDAVIEPTEEDNLKNLLIRVEEGKTGQLNFGAGYSSVDKLLGFVEVSQNNFDLFNFPTFDGGGQKLKLQAQLGGTRKDFVISFTEPWLFGKKLLFGLDIYKRSRSYSSVKYDEDRVGFSTRIGKPLTDFLRAYIIYKYEVIDIDPDSDAGPDIMAEEGRTDLSSIALKFDFDTRNRVMYASRGQHHTLYSEFAGLGGDLEFWKVELDTNFYFTPIPAWENVTLRTSAQAGIVEEYGDSDHVPVYERFFLGGPRTLRGFDYREVSPRDQYGDEVGGKFMWMGQAEVLIPVVEMIKFAVFADVGNVYPSLDDAEWGEFSADVGIGLRLNLPIGPLSFDYAFPVKTDKNTSDNDNPEFQFSIGGVF